VLLPWESFKTPRILAPLLGVGAVSYGLLKTSEVKEYEKDYALRRELRLSQLKKDLTLTTNALNPPVNEVVENPILDFKVKSFLSEVTGVAILGNSGSAKTCLVNYFCGELSPAPFLVLDPHADPDNPEYPWGWCQNVISDKELILQALADLLTLLDRKDRSHLIIICDEYPAIRMYAKSQKSTIADTFILRFGSEARKFNKLPFFISQSGNVKALGLEGQGDFLENFGLIRLQKIATKYLKYSPNVHLKEAIKTIAYPMLINEDLLYLHPTHGSYQTIRKGQKPLNLKPISTLPLPPTFSLAPTHTENHTGKPEKVTTVVDVGGFVGNNTDTFSHFPTPENITYNVALCPFCSSENVIKWGKDRKKCKDCNKTFKQIKEVK
jgi:hypothetical protein